jgi:hypothetical protein
MCSEIYSNRTLPLVVTSTRLLHQCDICYDKKRGKICVEGIHEYVNLLSVSDRLSLDAGIIITISLLFVERSRVMYF